MTDKKEIVMYVLMRNDMNSMTPGRACAQATHAANFCVGYIKKYHTQFPYVAQLLDEWENETSQCFGTTLVLAANNDQVKKIHMSIANNRQEYLLSAIVYDPEYAVQDGETVHMLSLYTCAWIFGYKHLIQPFVSELNLY